MKFFKNSYLAITLKVKPTTLLALVVGGSLAVGASVLATSLGSTLSVDQGISAVTLQITGGAGIGTASSTTGALETTGPALIGGVLNVTGATRLNGAATLAGTNTLSGATTISGAATLSGGATLSGTNTMSGATSFTSTATFGTNGTAVNSIMTGFCDFGPALANQTIAATSTGVVACTTQAPTGLAAGDKIWLTASTTNGTGLQPSVPGTNITVGLNYVYTGIASATSATRIQAVIYNLGAAAYTVTTSSWQYLIVK